MMLIYLSVLDLVMN